MTCFCFYWKCCWRDDSRVGWLSKLFVAVCICALLPPGNPSPSLETACLFSPTVPKISHTPALLIACLKRWSHWWLSFIKSPAGLKVPIHCYGTNLDSCHSNPPVLNRFHVIDSTTYLALISCMFVSYKTPWHTIWDCLGMWWKRVSSGVSFKGVCHFWISAVPSSLVMLRKSMFHVFNHIWTSSLH